MLSKEALTRFVEKGLGTSLNEGESPACFSENSGDEDVYMGDCMARIKVS